MLGWNSWWRCRLLRSQVLSEADWRDVVAALPLLQGFREEDLAALRELTILFLKRKSFEPAGGLVLDPAMKLRIAVEASLPILKLGFEYYRGWFSVIVYPDSFLVDGQYADEAGVVHAEREWRAGEAWERGPLILSWADIVAANGEAGNVVIHECAHKLDMLDGAANGLPPLHPGMNVAEWARVFTAAYSDLCWRVDAGLDTITPYASNSPAEFFAVASETFFGMPSLLKSAYPEVYEQLRAFYRQDPAVRLINGLSPP